MTVVDTRTGEVLAPLGDHEKAKLHTLERIIRQSKDEIGKALASIRDGRLYRETHGTFEEYCRERWGISRSTAYQNIMTFEIGETLSAIADKPINYGQARELAPLRDQPERMREVYETAKRITNGAPTADAIRRVREPEPVRYEPSGMDEFAEPEIVEAELVDEPDPTPRPSPEALAAHQKEQAQRQQREDHSRDFAQMIWRLGENAARVDAADYLVEIWQPSQDIYPKPTTADRIRAVADYLHDIADRWPE